MLPNSKGEKSVYTDKSVCVAGLSNALKHQSGLDFTFIPHN